MPATSEAMKHLACMALAYKRHGEHVLEGIEEKEAVRDMAASMSEEQLRDYCEAPIRKE